MQYEVLGQVLETVTGIKYEELLQERIVKPERLHRTFYTPVAFDGNTATSPVALSNASSLKCLVWGVARTLSWGQLARSKLCRRSSGSIHLFHRCRQYSDGPGRLASGCTKSVEALDPEPLKQIDALLQGVVAMSVKSLREKTYGGGWIRSQVPNIIDHFADYETPVSGARSPSRLMLNHQGYIAGHVGYVSSFPETSTAVIVFGRWAGLTDAMKLMGQSIIETVLDNDFHKTLYLEAAKHAANVTARGVSVT